MATYREIIDWVRTHHGFTAQTCWIADVKAFRGLVHATDHDDASSLMLRAYRKVSGMRDWDRPTTQTDIEDFLRQQLD